MMKDIKYIQSLISKWEEGTISSSEEYVLKEFLSKDAIDQEFIPYKILISGLDNLSTQHFREMEEFAPSLDFLSKEKDTIIHRQYPVVRKFLLSGITAAAAAIALFLFINREPLCYINGKPVHDQQTALAVVDYLDILSTLDQMPSELDALSTLIFNDYSNY